MQLYRILESSGKQIRVPVKMLERLRSVVFIVDYLVNVFFIRSLAKRVAIINVGNVFQHFSDFLCKFQISSCKADGNLCNHESVKVMYLSVQECKA